MIRGWLNRLQTWWQGRNGAAEKAPASVVAPPAPAADISSGPLERVILSDGVARTLFEDYADHRRSSRGQEEIGWDLLGYRQGREIIATAALPAGMDRDAGVAHVLFNRDVQELLSHILRQKDKRLGVVGVVHTHPGSMRHPSDGDFQGDRRWVGQLRGGEGVFAIGTADAHAERPNGAPSHHQQCFGELCFSWYALGKGDSAYRALSVQVAIGVDLASPFRAIGEILEAHARALNHLYRQLARVAFERVEPDGEPGLAVMIALAEPDQRLRLLLNGTEARYYWERDGELIAIDPREPRLDRAVFLILAELAKDSALASREAPTLVES